MLNSIYRLGKTLPNKIDSLLDDVTAKTVIGIIFKSKNGSVKYLKSQTYAFTKKSDYLYRKDPSGRPGLFLTGKIHFIDVDNLQKAIKGKINLKDPIVSKIVKNKISWLSRGKLLLKNELKKTLSDERQKEIVSFITEFDSKQDKIALDVINILTKGKPETVLLTVMFQDSGKPKFVGEIDDYVKFFKKGVFEKKYFTTPEKLVCNTCNKEEVIDTYTENPLPFYITNKPMYFPGALHTESKKGFSICDGCNQELQKGWRWIAQNLNFSIPVIAGKKPVLRFWLIPQLNEQSLMKAFGKSLAKKTLYLNSLKSLCETLDGISTWDKGSDKLNTFLKFSTMYYTLNDHALIQPVKYVTGIYPQRLDELLIAKSEVDDKFPYRLLSGILGRDFRVGFPVLAQIYEGSTPQWLDKLINTVTNIFTDNKVSIEDILTILNKKIEDLGIKKQDITEMSRISFQGLQLIEFLIRLNHEYNERNNMSSVKPINEQTAFYEKLVNSSPLLVSPTARAIHAIGTSVGILLHVQKTDRGSTPFWSNLSRLEHNLDKIMTYQADVKVKLSQYGIDRFDTLINYLGMISQNIDPSSDISKEQTKFILGNGISTGQEIAKGGIIHG